MKQLKSVLPGNLRMEPTMTLFYKQHPTLLPVVFMALLVVGCTSTKVVTETDIQRVTDNQIYSK